MRNALKIAGILLVCLMGVTLWSCSDDKDEPISQTELPDQAKTFLTQYFGTTEIANVTKDVDHGTTEYDVILVSGHKITFNAAGEWIDAEAPRGGQLPTGFIPGAITTYLATNYPGVTVTEISREKTGGYDVELANGLDLMFDANGTLLRVDR